MSTIKHSVISFTMIPKAMQGLDIEVLKFPVEEDVDLHCDVLISPLSHLFAAKFPAVWDRLRSQNRGAQLIVVSESNIQAEVLLNMHRQYQIFRIYETLEEPDFEFGLFEAIEKSSWIQQNAQLQILVQDQFEKLKILYSDLEERVQKRQRYLEESRRKNLIAQFRWNTLRRATESIHESSSVAEMEANLTTVLQESLNLLQVRILLHQQSSMAQGDKTHEQFSVHRVRLFQDQDVLIGYAMFMRDQSWPFSLEEKDFLQKISEAVSLAIRRLNQLEITKTLREQWQATFNAVSDPIALITQKYEVIQTNSAFAERAKGKSSTKCFQLLFGRDIPCTNCKLGQSFRVSVHKPKSETWDVHTQALKLSNDEEPAFFNQYRNITEQLRLETRLLEGAKLAELGIIGSSIAHELNNPLGGILTFVQMMKMDAKEGDPLRADLIEMEKGVLRCRDIVQNLLGFTRQAGTEEMAIFDLREALNRALSLIDLQTRAHGLDVRRQIPGTPMLVHGHMNLISQAIANLLQDSVQSVRQNSPKVPPHIEVIAMDNKDSVELRVLDNGLGQDVAPRISIPLAQQIVMDHKGQFEVTQPSKGLRLVRLTLPRQTS